MITLAQSSSFTKSVHICHKACAAGLIALLMTVTAAGQTVINTLVYTPPAITNNVGFDFEAVVVESTGLVYVGSTGAYGSEVGVIDPATNTLIKAIALPTTGPLSYAQVNQSTGMVYFRQSSSTIATVDGRPGTATFNEAWPSVTLGGSIQTFDIDETRNLLYVTHNDGSPHVSIIDVNPSSTNFNQIVATVDLSSGFVRGVSINETTNKIYVGTSAPGAFHVIDGMTKSVTTVATTGDVFDVEVNEGENLVYATSATTPTKVIMLDGVTNAITNIPLPAGPPLAFTSDERLAINTATEQVYLQSNEQVGTGHVIVVDGKRSSATFNAVVANIPVGRTANSGDIVVDEGLNRIVVTSFFDMRTTIIDGATNSIAAIFTSTQIPSDVAVNRVTHDAYVANQLNFVQAINITSGSLEATVVTGAETGLGVVNPNNHLFYVPRTVDTTDIRVFDRDGVEGAVSGSPNGSGRYLLSAINRNTNRIYVVNSSDISGTRVDEGYISVIDGNTNTVTANIPVGSQPFGITVNEVTNKIYVTNLGRGGAAFPGSITVVDGASNVATTANTAAMPVQAFFQPVVNQSTNKVYFLTTTGVVGVLNGATNIAMPIPTTATGNVIRVSQSLNRVYVASGSTLLVLDGNTDSQLTVVSSLGSISDLAINETTGQIFVLDASNDKVRLIDAATNNIVQSFSVGDSPAAIAINEVTNRVYVGNLNDKTISIINGATLNQTVVTVPLPLAPGDIHVDGALSRVYVATVDVGERGGVVIISDVSGTLQAIAQAIESAFSSALSTASAKASSSNGLLNSMLKKVKNAEKALAEGDTQGAIDLLTALASQVQAKRGDTLIEEQADRILSLIAVAIASLS
jgi:YVTN family beta-propeller protein